MRMRPLAVLFVLSVLARGVAHADDAWQPTEGWFTLHHDVMRTGRTQDSPGVPFQYVGSIAVSWELRGIS
jgi:hypothetical protein